MNTDLDEECVSCAMKDEEGREKCPKSKRECGHHCNHSWSHDVCCWCHKKWGEIA